MASPVPVTRQSDSVFLLGIRDVDSLTRLNQLPTSRQVLLRFHWHLNELKSVRNASHVTVEELTQLWGRAFIPTRLNKHCVEKIEKLHSNWLLLKKNKSRNSKSQKAREHEFVSELDSLFDIAHADALALIKIEEDRKFLIDQRDQRKMVMTTVDKDLAKKQERTLKRLKDEEERKRKAQLLETTPSTSKGISSMYESHFEIENPSDTSDSSEDEEYRASTSVKKKSRYQIAEEPANESGSGKSIKAAKQSLFSKHVTSALDRNKVSDREALRLMVPIAAALGHDPSALPLSRSTIQRKRKEGRKTMFEEIKQSVSFDDPVIVHWDGKILPDILGTEKVDRLPVLVSADGREKLLGVPKLVSGTGANSANAVYDVLTEWDLEKKIVGMCFDTTSVNTGSKTGACVLLEHKVEEDLLWLACRHHILEIVLSKVFTLCFGPSSSPDIPLFKRFKAAWQFIHQDNYKPLEDATSNDNFKLTAVNALLAVFDRKNQPRDDYMELIELSLLALGHTLDKVHWRAPGALHHARWMAKLLYAIKIYLFREEDGFQTTQRERSQIERFVKFGALVYVKYWFEAPVATNAAWADLSLWKDMTAYEAIDPQISEVVRNAMKSHLWYLSDELVGFSLFSDKVENEAKAEIVEKMERDPNDRKVRGDPSLLSDQAKLADFANKRSLQVLNKLKINTTFLTTCPNEWANIANNKHYVRGKEIIKNLKVVNDIAERGVKLFEEFNKLLTNDEEEKQLLLQVVEANRKWVPTITTKKAVVKSLGPSTSEN